MSIGGVGAYINQDLVVADNSPTAVRCCVRLLRSGSPDRAVVSDLRCREALGVAGHATKMRSSHKAFSFSSAAMAGVDVGLKHDAMPDYVGRRVYLKAPGPYRPARRNSINRLSAVGALGTNQLQQP